MANSPPTLKPTKQPMAVSKKVTPIAFAKKITFQIVKNLGFLQLVSPLLNYPYFCFEKYLPIIASKNVAIKVITI